VELPLTLWPLWLLKNISSSAMLIEYHSYMFFSDMEQDTMKKNGTPSPPSGLVFNISRYMSRVRVLTSSTLN
jgi:hypothetical protein